jgi:hypothetical protein
MPPYFQYFNSIDFIIPAEFQFLDLNLDEVQQVQQSVYF